MSQEFIYLFIYHQDVLEIKGKKVVYKYKEDIDR